MEQSIARFEKLLEGVENQIPFLLMNPLNEESERKRFFAEKNNGREYDPVFRYKKAPAPTTLFKKMDSINLGEDEISRLLKDKLKSFKNAALLAKSVGKEGFTGFSCEKFGTPKKSLVRHAYSILEKKAEKEEENVTTDEACRAGTAILKKLGLNDWKITRKNMASNAAVLATKKEVIIKKNSVFPKSFLKRMLVHEIGVHVLRASNGATQPFRIFRTGLPDYLLTEEGLAVNAEEMNGCLKVNTLRAYAGRVVAVNHALDHSFTEVFSELSKYFDDSHAWKIALRVKRGQKDTSRPGAYTKDYLYLAGYYDVKSYLENAGPLGLQTLYYGKIGIQHAPLIKRMAGLREPTITPASKEFQQMISEVIN